MTLWRPPDRSELRGAEGGEICGPVFAVGVACAEFSPDRLGQGGCHSGGYRLGGRGQRRRLSAHGGKHPL